MIWKQVSPEIWTAEYYDYKVTAILEYRYAEGDHYTYIAVLGDTEYKTCSWQYLRSRILKSRQLSLFP